MRTRFAFLAVLVSLPLSARTPAQQPVPKAAAIATPKLFFEPNVGQADARAVFLARASNYTLFVERSGSAVIAARGESAALDLVGASMPLMTESLEPTGGISNYYKGTDPAQWRSAIANYGRVEYRGVYAGIDLTWHGSDSNAGNHAEFDFVVAPGADPNLIQLKLQAGSSARLDPNGDVIVASSRGEFRLVRPTAFQEHVSVPAAYDLKSSGTVSFRIGAYDRRLPLTIDPVIVYSTYLGEATPQNAFRELVKAAAVDAAGNFFLCSDVHTNTFPTTPGAFDTSFNGGDGDIVLSRLAVNGTSLTFSSYIGGNGDEQCNGLVLDAAGNPIITGNTDSDNFPTTSGAVQQIRGGDTDAFVTKLNAAGTSLQFSTLIGGADLDEGDAVAVDSSGNVYVAGSTSSQNFPLGPGGLLSGNSSLSAFVVKLNPTATTRFYSALLADCVPTDLVVDAAGNAYIAGDGYANFVTTPGVINPSHGSRRPGGAGYIQDAFVAKISPGGGSLVFATFLGGTRGDLAYRLAVDNASNIYVEGITSSSDFPATAGAFRTVPPAGSPTGDPLDEPTDVFVVKLNPTATAIIYSTFLGIPNAPLAFRLAADGTIWIGGISVNPNYPRSGDAFPKIPSATDPDILLLHLNATGTQLLYSSTLGTASFEFGAVMALAASGDLYIAANTDQAVAPNFPGVTTTTIGSDPNIWLLKISQQQPSIPNLDVLSAASYLYPAPVAPLAIVVGFGAGMSVSNATANSPWPAALVGTSVKVKDSQGVERTAGLVYVFPTLVSFLIPAGSANGAATVDVIHDGSVVSRGAITIASVSPGFFTANANGAGVASAVAIHVKADGTQPYELIFTCTGGSGSCAATPLDLGPATDKLILSLYGTGIRGRSSNSAVVATAGGATLEVQYAGQQGTIDGLDQINLVIPRSLIGKGLLTLQVTIDGVAANPIQFRVL